MFKKNFLGVLLGIFALVLIPTAALAQTLPSVDDAAAIYEDVTTDSLDDWDWDDTYDSLDDLDDYDTYEIGDEAMLGAISAFIGLVGLIVLLPIALVVYVYTALAYSTIAKKLDVANGWFAWVPILNVVLMFQVAGMSGWFILLTLIPIVNIVVMVWAMMKTCERRGMEQLLGLLMLIPIANFVLLGVLAWKKDGAK
ncbi:DUF5684 domain-containing protein [bacterium]|nr:DUF5684 domain-containing protein [bacterium]